MRYKVQIKFTHYPFDKWDIEEPCKSLKKALSFKHLIDDSVRKAQIYDTVRNYVVIVWK